MKKIASSLIAALALTAFAGVALANPPAAGLPAGHPPMPAQGTPAGHPPVSKEEVKAKPAKKVKKAKKAAKKEVEKATPATPATPAAPAGK